MTEARRCVSCGMPLRKPEDYPLGDTSKDYCRHCARPDGCLQGYEERLAGMAGFLWRTQGLDEGAAQEMARRLMAELPAWEGRSLTAWRTRSHKRRKL